MRFSPLARHWLIIEFVLTIFPVFARAADAAGLHEALPEADAWQIVLAGVMMLAAIGRKHFMSDQ